MRNVIRAKRRRTLPVVLAGEEVRRVLAAVDNDADRLIFQVLYGTGMRLTEGLRLRVKDIDLAYNQITVRDGKGFKDRVTMLPALVKPSLAEHLKPVRAQHQRDLKKGFYLTLWRGNIPRRPPSGFGSLCFLHLISREIRARGPSGDTTAIREHSSGASSGLSGKLES